MDEGYHKPDRAEKMAFTQEVGLKSLYGESLGPSKTGQ